MEKNKKIILGFIIALIIIIGIGIAIVSISSSLIKDKELEEKFNNGTINDVVMPLHRMSFSEIESYMKYDFVKKMNYRNEYTWGYLEGNATTNYYVFRYIINSNSTSGIYDIIINKNTGKSSTYVLFVRDKGSGNIYTNSDLST